MVLIHLPVGQDQDVGPLPDDTVHFDEQVFHGFFQAGILIIGDRNLRHLEAVHFHVFYFQQICIGQDGVAHFQHFAVFFFFLQKVTILPHIDRGGGHHFLPDGVDGRIGHLGETLFEIPKQRLVFLGKHGQGHIDSHSRNAFRPGFRHIQYGRLDLLVGVAECLLQPGAFLPGIDRHLLVWDLQVF